ncbi:caspase domain-containing protein [Acidobacteriota bacterium]
MNRSRIVLCGLIFLLLTSQMLLSSNQTDDSLYTRRFALIVGSNNGGDSRVTLRYAVDDAVAIKRVLEGMGGVLPEDSRFLAEPNRDTFLKEIRNLSRNVKKAKKNHRRIEVILYYSGHSDEFNLFLGKDRVSYKEFRDLITSMEADVRIAILDSCASGALTLPKGVIKRTPFLMDTSYDMKGYAFMTSSSASEAAQESGQLKRSFFTHNLISGMRGGADVNQDGRITLSEAYQFAFDGTLSQTEKTMAGPQHPNYHIQMSGTGDVVITEIWKSTAVLVLQENVDGRIYIHNEDDVLVVELNKKTGREISIGLNAGTYRIINLNRSGVFESNVTLKTGKSLELDQKQFHQTDKIPTQVRGGVSQLFPEEYAGRSPSRWRIELFGGYATMNPSDLNLRANHDDITMMFYNDDYYRYLESVGYVDSYSRMNLGGTASLINSSQPLGIRFRYSLNHWLDLSLGFTGFSTTRNSNFTNTYSVNQADGISYTYTDDITNYRFSARAFAPLLGLHAGMYLSPAMRLEAFFTGGPLFADCLYKIEWGTQYIISTSPGDPENSNIGMLEEKGKGMGLALQLGVKLDYYFSRHWGIFLESGYAYQAVSNLYGPGKRIMTDRSDYWEGQWAIKRKIIERDWGIKYSVYPSNGWEGFEWTGWRDRDFILNLSGVQARMGFIYRF